MPVSGLEMRFFHASRIEGSSFNKTSPYGRYLMEIRKKITEMLLHVSDIEGNLVSSLTQEERATPGTYDDWSIKDQIAHCAAWMDRLAKNISVAIEGISPTRPEDIDEENEEIFLEFDRQSWEEVLSYSGQAKASLIEIVQNVSDEDLFISELLPWQGGRELWKVILGTGYTHPLTHYSQVHMKLGHMEQAREIQEQMSQNLMGLDENPSWQGVALYNLACFYALFGEKDKAISGLKEALRRNPALTDWSKQDPDFNSIRDDTDFLAVYVT
jgi:tetratricopeptide (TPR) repeat protein